MGNLLLIISGLYVVYLYLPLAEAIIKYEIKLNRNNTQAAVSPIPSRKPEEVLVLTPTPIVEEYSLEIPKIEAKAKIITGVSPFNEKEYRKVLEDNNVAQAKGSDMPGSGAGHSTYIFAHSTEQNINLVRKNSIFYLLGELKNGDEVIINLDGEKRIYKVYKQQVVGANEIEYLKYTEPDKEVLILQTCWPIGTAWKRLLVFTSFESAK